jgi:hypothetical protein
VSAVTLPEWAPRLLTPGEARTVLGVSWAGLHYLRVNGRIRAVELPPAGPGCYPHHRYYAEEIAALAEQNRQVR